ncbi:ATP-grasp ribosomal peptide maturase [Anaeromyxobacter oryzae]|uniref:ATP-grasp ribosomal peptide maturase n=1 Tax=Anaeromyxobacter oryzae TaxID=2918170 RepID=A0ABM7WU43_9BACT|nr:ATP-grasp ribosomal peptide maturase [Anaeromyxobacter oryzae]
MILAVAPRDDVHAAAVSRALSARGEELIRLDLSRFPRRGTIALGVERGPGQLVLRDGRRTIDVSRCRAIWWRRPAPFALPAEVGPPALRGFALAETSAAFSALWLSVRTRWVNDPVRTEIASRKPHQLAVAAAAGLAVPRTLVTSDPGRARAFLRACGARHGAPAAVLKTLTPLPDRHAFTRRVTARDVAALGALRHAPVILQERVDGVDLRVTAVGGRLFAMEVDARDTAFPDDVRQDWPAAARTARPARLPPAVAAGIRAVMDRLGLVYGAFDLRRRDDGEHLFLEVNPAGQWLFVEDATGLPITAAVAELLLGRRGGAARRGAR